MLRFSLSDIPVGVHFSFLIIALFGGYTGFAEIATWTFAAFVAVLFHEAGHAFTARHYGAVPVRITLFAMGGVTVYPANEDLTPGRRFLIAAAGSTVGIVTGGILLLGVWSDVVNPSNRVLQVLVEGYIFASLGWGILNWIPIRPLDGGAMMTSVLEIVAPRSGVVIARYFSLFVGATLATVLYLRFNLTILAIFVLFITAAGFADRSELRRKSPAPGAVGPVQPPPESATERGLSLGDDQVREDQVREETSYDDPSPDEPDTSFPI